MTGPLAGTRVVEFAGLGPVPFAAMMLADMGADVLRIDRVGAGGGESAAGSDAPVDLMLRNRRSVGIDVKQPSGVKAALRLVANSDAVVEGFRPGVMERIGLGPETCLEENPRLIYGRMTGWGQTGPYASVAGHDINYISLAGALAHFGRSGGPPTPPMNILGDFGGGGMLLAFGVLCGLLEAARSGQGQVIDAAMVDGTASLMTMLWSFRAARIHDMERRGVNMVDTGAHFYEVYECADGEYVSIGAIEPKFYDELIGLLGLSADDDFSRQQDSDLWPTLKERLSAIFIQRTQAEWCSVLEYTDACFAPVLRADEAASHPHNRHRETFVEAFGVLQPAPAPRFSRSQPQLAMPPARPGQHTREALLDWGFRASEVDELADRGAITSC